MVKITLRGKMLEVTPGKPVGETMRALGYPPESYLVVRQGQLMTEDELLREGDEIRLVPVISGG